MSVLTSMLNHDFDLSNLRRTADGQGGYVEDYVAAGTVSGRLRPASSSEREVAQLEERTITHIFYCQADETIVRGDLISLDSLSVTVEAIREPSLAAHQLEVECRERQFEESV